VSYFSVVSMFTTYSASTGREDSAGDNETCLCLPIDLRRSPVVCVSSCDGGIVELWQMCQQRSGIYPAGDVANTAKLKHPHENDEARSGNGGHRP